MEKGRLGGWVVVALALVWSVSAFSKEVQGWRLVWADEFNRPAGTPVDPAKWNVETGGWGWGNRELQYYTDSTLNVVHDGRGNLAITASRQRIPGLACWYGACRYTSARINTGGKFEKLYGRFEARIKVPRGQGLWPAFWMLGNNFKQVGWPSCGEIDIMEHIGREPRTVYGTVHGPGYSGADGIGAGYTFSEDLADKFHVFAVEWEPNEIRWYVDGILYHTVTPDKLPAGAPWVFNRPFFLILNLAVGGYWPGYPDESTRFPQRMLIDYVRVYDREQR